MTPDRAPATEERVRRMMRRLQVSARDAEAWLGILRQILWEIRFGKRSAG
jgi:tRNA C32,U32 (ribose-2'-O)-methylase TrmJ